MSKMESSDVWWLMKEIWPWTVGVPSVGFVLNLILVKVNFGILMSVAFALSILVAAAFQWNAGWGGGEFRAFGVAINFLAILFPAAIAMFIGASLSRLFTSLLVRS